MASEKITGEMVVRALKAIGRSETVKAIAAKLGTTDTRAIATAARAPVKDGRITISYRHSKRNRGVALYRFVRLTAKEETTHGE